MWCGDVARAGSGRHAVLAVTLCVTLAAGVRATELGDIVAVPVAGQSADQTRRDRYECHNWAVAQNGTVPAPGPTDQQAARDRRAERIGKVVTGAAVGAAAGSIIRGADDHRDADDGALAGGVIGAIAGAVIGRNKERDEENETFNEYFRALDACMTARGYDLQITGAE